jgi:trimethylamine-N-oxide reductase cytochrome c-type subunit TorC
MRRWIAVLALLAVGGVAGAGAILASIEVNRYTSTDGFCTSCHSMAHLAAEPQFARSAHRSNLAGVQPSCGDCHIPATNWFTETYTHVAKGLRDVIAEKSNNYSDPAVWEKRRVELAHSVREEMRSQDSVTCRRCHDAAAIRPASQRGLAAHELVREGRVTCIDCHFNLAHAPVSPQTSFIRGSALGRQKN